MSCVKYVELHNFTMSKILSDQRIFKCDDEKTLFKIHVYIILYTIDML